MGLFITRKTLPYSVGHPAGFTLQSDVHIGSADVNYDGLKHEIREAESNNDRVLINGDLFDCILPKDHKRFRPDALCLELQGRSDVLDAALDMAVELYRPVAGRIDMVGLGNHESAVEKYHGSDMIARFIRALGGQAQYGGYTGFVDYRFRQPKHPQSNSRRFVLYYHHGGGGSAPVTKGMIDFSRKQWVDADVVWLGHKHNRLVDSTPLRMRCPMDGDSPIMDKTINIMTGGYMDVYDGQTHEDVMQRGRKASYASDWGLPPQASGGVRVLVKFHRRSGIENIQVVI